MVVRVLAVLLAALVAMWAVAPAGAAASPVTAELVDDGGPDLEPAIAAAPVALVAPPPRVLRVAAAPPAVPHGRLHHAWVFRPPRGFASR
jgi:hypothetical protein